MQFWPIEQKHPSHLSRVFSRQDWSFCRSPNLVRPGSSVRWRLTTEITREYRNRSIQEKENSGGLIISGFSLRRRLNTQHAMVRRKVQPALETVAWPLTPDPSPSLAPIVYVTDIIDNFTVSKEHPGGSRPISMASTRDGFISPAARPTLDDVLNGRAPPPYTLAAYTAFLSEQHCLETLEFSVESKKYREKYDEAVAHLAGMPFTVETDEGFELQQDWTRILDIYIRPGAPREINLPAEERDDLVEWPFGLKPPPPEALEPAVKRMHDLMAESIFIPFCNNLRTISHAQTYNALSEYSQRHSRHIDDRGTSYPHNPAHRRKSPPSTSHSSSNFRPSRSPPSQHRPSQNSARSSGLSRTSGQRITPYVSSSSTGSVGESAVADSESSDSILPADRHLLSPPVTPPAGEPSFHSSGSQTSSPNAPRPQRTESGGWKKMSQKIWPGRKKNGSGLSRDDAS